MESITSITFPEEESKTDNDDLNEFEVCWCIFIYFFFLVKIELTPGSLKVIQI